MNLNNTNTNPNSQDLKRQVLEDIERVKDDLSQIKRRMTPGQLIDDAIFYRRIDKSPKAVFEYMKSNPVGSAFLTLGAILLMEDEQHSSFENVVKSKVSSSSAALKTKTQGIKENIKSKASELKDKAASLREKFEKHDEKASWDEEIESLPGLKDKVLSSSRENIEQLYDKAKNLDPLTYMAIGLGLGSMTGASLPVAQREELMVSGVGDKLTNFRTDLEKALNESFNILKKEVVGDLTEDWQLFS